MRVIAQAFMEPLHMQTSFWCAARLMLRREALATHCLGLAGFDVYLPRLRERRIIRGKRVEVNPPLFPGYCFVLIVLQWHAARWCPGVFNLIMDGSGPAHVPDAVIAEIRARERGGLIELPKPPALKPGDRVRITSGAFGGHLALYAGQTGHERVAVLLQFLGAQQRTELPAAAIAPVELVP
jgi:transcriptional antiterminator RfaH